MHLLLILNVGQRNKMKYHTLTLINKYISYLWKASNGRGHGVHSPFVYAFIKNVLNTGTTVFAVEAFVVVEQIASALEENAKALKANANALNALVALINREKGITVDYEECY